MPVYHPPVNNLSAQSSLTSPRHRRLALWLIIGCVPASVLSAHRPAAAEELDWASGLTFSPPQTQQSFNPASLGEPQSIVSGQAAGKQVAVKVPTFRPTSTVHSVLGMKPGQQSYPVGTSIQLLPPQMAAPAAPPVSSEVAISPANDARLPINSVKPAVPSPPKSAASLVTRDNAQLHSMQQSWQTNPPAAPTMSRELVLRSVQPGLDPNSAPERSLATPHALLSPPQQLASQATPPSQANPTNAPSGLPYFSADSNAMPAADRRGYPAWLAPGDGLPSRSSADYANGAIESQDSWQPRGQAQPRQPLRDPLPTLTRPQSVAPPSETQLAAPAPRQNLPVGSGVTAPAKQTIAPQTIAPQAIAPQTLAPQTSAPQTIAPQTLAPVQRMPSLESLQSPANERAIVTGTTEDRVVVDLKELATLESLVDDADSKTLQAPPVAKVKESVESVESVKKTTTKTTSKTSVAVTSIPEGNNEGDAAAPLALEDIDSTTTGNLEDNSIMHQLLEKTTISNEHTTRSRDTNDGREARPGLSTMEIKPLSINPTGPLQPLERGAELRDVREDTAAKSESRSTDQLKTLPSSRLAQLDATGRLKSYSGITAVPNLDPAIVRMQQPILQTLRTFHTRTEQADKRSNWGMMHAIMVYGADTRIIARRQNYSAIAWMAGNNVCRGNRLMTTDRGKIAIREGTGLQGHQSQWLAVLSLAGVPATYPLYVDGSQFAVEDLVQVEAAACEEGKELTFTLIGLAHYLDTDATWTGVRGERWNFERLIAAELNEPIVGAACGGTHRLMGFAHALRKRRLEGEPITGQWKRAEDFLDEFVQYTYTMQNRDGSFSTDWYESRQDNGELQRKVQVTGHMLEFLLTHLPDDQLDDQHVVSAARFLTNAMGRVELDDAGVGYRGHALRSLAMFYRRMYGVTPEYPPGQMAFGQHNHYRKR